MFLAAAIGVSYFIVDLARNGLYYNWVRIPPCDVHTAKGSSGCLDRLDLAKSVLGGWWANPSTHGWGFAILIGIGTYLWYFVLKQWAMGFVFLTFVRRTFAAGFGVVEDMELNSDGHYGLRYLRRFMQWTYISTVSHLLVYGLVFWLWFQIGGLSIGVGLLLSIIALLIVVLPSSSAYNGVIRSRRAYISKNRSTMTPDVVEALWKRPVLPFRIRDSVFALAIYLLFPLTLSLLSQKL